jgi:capsular polysaccharide biosynthesis protein
MEQLYVLLRTKYEEARIAEAMQTADVQVIDDAILPEEPVKPRVKLNIAIGGVLGVFLGVGVAFLLEFMDNTLNTKEEAERLLGVPVLGQIPDNNLLEDMEKKRFPWRKGRDFSA